MCNFCRHNERNQHHSHCPRNAPDAQAQYDKGYRDGRRGRDFDASNTNPAYSVGWSRGNSAYEDWLEGPNWYGEAGY